MPNYFHRKRKQVLLSFSPASLPDPASNYIFMPDLNAVAGVPSIYWTIMGDAVSEMSQAEKDAVDEAILSNARDSIIEEDIDNLESTMRQLTQMTIREINILRQQFNTTTAEVAQLTDTSFADRTMAQVKSQMRSDLGA